MTSSSSSSSSSFQSKKTLPDASLTSSLKKPLAHAYNLASKLYMMVAAGILFLPDARTAGTRLASKWGGACGYAASAAACQCLHKATLADRLTSDTYKRLNLGLLGFGLTFWALPAEADFLKSGTRAKAVTSGILCATKLVGLVLSLFGWQYGVDASMGPSFFKPGKLASESVSGVRSTLAGLKVKDKKKATFYRNCLVFVLAGIVASLMQGILDTTSILNSSIQWSAVSRLWLFATMVYSLKDAAERDRLSGSTFIQMNFLIGIWGLGMGLSQGIRGYWIEMSLFSIPFLVKGFKSLKAKKSD